MSDIAIANCPRCCQIPQKLQIDLDEGGEVPPPVQELTVVLEMEDAYTHRYCTSITRLLKCPDCDTYYYYNDYDDNGEFFMDPASEEVTVRRLDPFSALDFLRWVVAGPENALPNPMTQLVKAFLDGTGAPDTYIRNAKINAIQKRARHEFDTLQAQYPTLIAEVRTGLQAGAPNWHIQRYWMESLLYHFAVQGEWEGLSVELLAHPDPAVRLEAAMLALSIGSQDAPAIDLVVTPLPVREALETLVSTKARLKMLAAVLCDTARADPGETLVYDYNFGDSKYVKGSLRERALYGLVVAAGKGVRALDFIPELIAMLQPGEWTNYRVAWVLRVYAQKSKAAARIIQGGLEALAASERAAVLDLQEIQEALAACQRRTQRG